VLAAAVVVVTSLVGGVNAQAQTVNTDPATSDTASAQRVVDALGGSGTAGIAADEAEDITLAEQASLTGDIKFSVPSGTFQNQVSVQLSTTIASAQIRYTTNGTVPTATSTQYSTALTFTATTQLRARAFVNGAASGAMGTAMYVARAINTTHDLPLLVLDAYGAGKPTKTAVKDVAVMVMNRPTGGTASLAQAPAVATRGSFNLRGQSSANFQKAPYKLDLLDNENGDAKYPLVGMPADSDWILRGPFPDKSLMRDALAYGLGATWPAGSRFAFIEVYLNLDQTPLSADDYQVSTCSTRRSNGDRLDIPKPAQPTWPSRESADYLMKLNMMAAEALLVPCVQKTTTYRWRDLELTEPSSPQAAQLTWIGNYVQKFHDSLRSANPSNAQTGYPAYIDVDSFVNRIIIEELAKAPDGYVRSFHLFKPKNGKLTAGPLWDYDIALGGFSQVATGWQYQQGFMMNKGTAWIMSLMRDSSFQSKIATRWRTLRQQGGALSNAQVATKVNALAATLTNAAQRNFQKWPILGTSQVGGFTTQTSQTWQQQVTFLTNYLTQRSAWLDSSNWPSPTTDPWAGTTAAVS
jgi:hypothetical protein